MHMGLFLSTPAIYMSSNRPYLQPDGNNKPEKNVKVERIGVIFLTVCGGGGGGVGWCGGGVS